MQKIFVCAGMGLAKNEKINIEAQKLGKILANNNVRYVQGGYADGLMGKTLKEFLKYSNNVEFYIPAAYYDYDAPALKKLVGDDAFCATKVENEMERLLKIKACDRVIVLPGGTGTLEELLFCNEMKRAEKHERIIDLVNIEGFFDGFLKQVERNMLEGFSSKDTIKFNVVKSVDELKFNDNKKTLLPKQ